ncbi:hypothetical protein ABF87_01625 [Nitrosomonas sp. JL21]|uniref:hypothetical protein n=1 Tax=Nitrosomonas sp. JL21 TaxID=153949 RepID=UPI00136A1B51|nr:hypothetical protein [Nitrosomonas sp. JL21]MBL8498075.1 hypothetical protein [Nitrosomonas sp.]MXS76677.1 hypothetical protein [Nitrosomonas sp. JL21]
MKKIMNTLLATGFGIALLGYMTLSSAHEEPNIPMDVNSDNAGFIGYAVVNCSNLVGTDIATDYFVAQVEDLSPPQDNLFLSVQVIKDRLAANATDPVSGDGEPGPEARVYGGNGNYLVLVNKTAAGMRTFNFTYHCKAIANDVHTETSAPNVLYYQ